MWPKYSPGNRKIISPSTYRQGEVHMFWARAQLSSCDETCPFISENRTWFQSLGPCNTDHRHTWLECTPWTQKLHCGRWGRELISHRAEATSELVSSDSGCRWEASQPHFLPAASMWNRTHQPCPRSICWVRFPGSGSSWPEGPELFWAAQHLPWSAHCATGLSVWHSWTRKGSYAYISLLMFLDGVFWNGFIKSAIAIRFE